MRRTFSEHLDPAVQPKRILALDGGGLRGVLTIAFLERVETILRDKTGGGADFRLCDHYDLIGGTSTGSIIAAGLSLGMSVGEIRKHYFALGANIFKPTCWRMPLVSQEFDAKKVMAALTGVFGDRTLESEDFRTGLMIMSKRLDTGSPWPLTNHPDSPYFQGGRSQGTVPNKLFKLASIVRASTAAPTYFEPESILIREADEQAGHPPVHGEFVDGGISTANNPALQMVLIATVKRYGFGWEMGPDKLSVTSLGTGRSSSDLGLSTGIGSIAPAHGLKALKSVLEDCEDLVEVMMQWMSESRTARTIDSAMGDLAGSCVGGKPALNYLRYNVRFEPAWFREHMDMEVPREKLDNLALMDKPGNMEELEAIGKKAAERFIQAKDFEV